MKRFLLVLSILMLFVTIVDAKDKRYAYSVMAGPNFSYMTIGDAWSDVKVGVNIGVAAKSNLDKLVFCELGVLFSYQGMIERQDINNYVVWNLGYIKAPVMLAFRIPVSEKITILPSVGFYGAISLFANIEYNMPEDGVVSDYPVNVLNYIIHPIDGGMKFGLAMDVDRFRIGLTYDHGLADISKIGADVQNRVMAVNLGFNF